MKRGDRSTCPVLSVCLSIIKKVSARWPGLPGGAVVKNLPAKSRNTGDMASCLYPKDHWVGNGEPLPYSCLENSTDREAWGAIVHRVTNSPTQLNE